MPCVGMGGLLGDRLVDDGRWIREFTAGREGGAGFNEVAVFDVGLRSHERWSNAYIQHRWDQPAGLVLGFFDDFIDGLRDERQ